MRNFFEFSGKRSSDFDVYISGSGTFGSPEKDIETIIVPGRNGELTIDKKRFSNLSIQYPAFIIRDFENNRNNLQAFLSSQSGYKKLCDTYHSNYFRMAYFKGPIEFDMRALNRSGEMTIEFICKPQKYLYSGEKWFDFSIDGNITNPTLFQSFPVLEISQGSGSLEIAGQVLNVKNLPEKAIIDCEIEDAVGENMIENLNQYVSGDFPKINPRKNGIRITGDIKVRIKPRWWTI